MPETALSIVPKNVLSEVRKHVKRNFTMESKRFFGFVQRSDDTILKFWHNIDTTEIQQFNSSRLFKIFANVDASFSAALHAHVRMLVEDYRVTAKKVNGKPSAEGQKYLDTLVDSMNHTDGLSGFALPNTVPDIVARIGRNILTSDNASGALFVALDQKYRAVKFHVLDCDGVYFETKGDRHVPYVIKNGRRVSLDFANFLWQPMDPGAEQVTGNNPLRPGLRTSFTKMEFLSNLRKVLRNQAWPKVKVTINEEAVINMAPPEVRQDAKKLIEFMTDYIGKVEDQLTGIDPDQNIVTYNTIEDISYLETTGNFDPAPYAKLLEGENISGYKAPSSVVGRGGNQDTGEGLGSAELVIFRRTIKAFRRTIEELMSRALTLSMRLEGLQGRAKFAFKEFTLRPPEESAQFNSIEVDTIINAWNNGAIGDTEKDKKIRHLLGEDGPAPSDANVRNVDLPMSSKEVMRSPDAEEERENNRRETRKDQKTGNNR